MFISKNNYVNLVSHNKNLTKEVNELKRQIEYLTVTKDEYYKGAIKWRSMYIKMRDEKKGNEEIKSPIVEQRDAEIEALKHMLERTEAENKSLKTVVRALNKDNDRLVEELNECKQKLNYLRDVFETNLDVAEFNHDVDKVKMWQAFVKEVE